MMTKEKIWSWVTVAFAICVTAYMLSYIVLTPWHIIPGLHDDATKNTYTYLYQSVYGKGYWFDGMNYPYGEHIVYTDGVPLLSVLFTTIGNVSVETALTVLWWLVGFSYILCIVFVYKILIRFRLSFPLAVIFAGLISVFSPQVFRMGGHYALSFLCVVPMLFYWTIKYSDLSQKKYCIYIFLLGTVTAFLHPYFAAMTLMWGLFYTFAYIICTRRQAAQKARHIWPILAAILAVFAIVTIVMKLSDPVKDRPLTPYGMLTYTTYKRDIFTSIFSPVWKYLKDHKVRPLPNISEGSEGYTYMGLVAIGAVLFSIATGIYYLLRKKKEKLVVGTNAFSPVWLLMSVFALLFSMGVPYIWHMEWLLDQFPFLRQFRSLGRFTWIFYYIITVYAVVVIYTHYQTQLIRRKFYGYAVMFLAIFIWAFEASGYTKYIRGIASLAEGNYNKYLSKNEQSWSAFLQEHNYKAADFQAILGISFFHIGSDKLWIGDGGSRMTPAGIASFQLRLPIVDVMMSRTSLSQTMKQVRINGGPFADKALLRDAKNNKPFLLLRYDADVLTEDQQYLLSCAQQLGQYSGCTIYALYPDNLRAADKKWRDSVTAILPYMTGADTCVGNNGAWYINHFDDMHAAEAFFGSSAQLHIHDSDSVVAVIPIHPQHDGQEYECSGWFLLTDKNYGSPNIILESLDGSGNKIAEDILMVKASVDNNGMWFRGSLTFKMKEQCRSIRCRLINELHPSYLAMDELMLRPLGSLLISRSGNRVMANNHLLAKENK